MNESRRSFLLSALKLFDLALVTMSFGLTIAVVYSGSGPSLAHLLSIRVKLWNFIIFLGIALVWHVVFSLCGMYGSKRLSTRGREVVDGLRGTTLCVVSLALVAKFFSISIVTPRFIAVFWFLSGAAVALGRLLLRYFLAAVRVRGRNLRHMLILGTNARAIEFATSLEGRPELGYRIVGFVDENWSGAAQFTKTRRKVACDFDSLPEFLRHNVVDEVANYLPLRSFYVHASQVAALCELHGIVLRLDSDIFGLKTTRSLIGEFNVEHYVASASGMREGWQMVAKRTLDVVASAILLALLAPLFLVMAILIKATSAGPIFFLQERVGYNKRRFRMYKFRTMIPGAEQLMAELEKLNEASGPVFKIKNDPRITPLGKFLRRTSIDELPQLINVLKGDMSLVGPRPLPVRDYQGFSEDWQRRRLSARPGITCLWQVNGRCAITFEQWMKMDLQYVDEWSLWLDLKILARTIPAVLKGSGAA